MEMNVRISLRNSFWIICVQPTHASKCEMLSFLVRHPHSATGFTLFGAWFDVFNIICHNQSHSLQSDRSVKKKEKIFVEFLRQPFFRSFVFFSYVLVLLRIFHIVYYVNMFIQYYLFSIPYSVELSLFSLASQFNRFRKYHAELTKWLNIQMPVNQKTFRRAML